MSDHKTFYIICNNKTDKIFREVKKNVSDNFHEIINLREFTPIIEKDHRDNSIILFEISEDTVESVIDFYKKITVDSNYIFIFLISEKETPILEKITDLKHDGAIFYPFDKEKLIYVINNSFRKARTEQYNKERQDEFIRYHNENKNKVLTHRRHYRDIKT